MAVKGKLAGWLMPLAALISLPGTVLAQAAQEPGNNLSTPEAEAFGQSLNPQERSEWINRKTYTAQEWQAAENALTANLVACEKSDAQACKAAGDAYASGDGVWSVPAIAYILYDEACDGGVGAACRAFFELSDSGYGQPEGGYVEPAGLLERGCDLGDLVACDKFAEILLTDTADPAIIARANAIWEQACAAGGQQACLSLSDRLVESDRLENQARAASLRDAMCRKGSVAACKAIIWVAQNGQDPEPLLARQYQDLACDFGSADECINLAEQFYRGEGVTQDRELALAYFDKGCVADLGYCDVAESARAIPDLRTACTAQGDAEACVRLGRVLASWPTPESDREAALALFQSGCLAGLGDACIDAASIIAGRSTYDDPARLTAIRDWLERGCNAGYLQACLTLAQELESTDPYNAADRYSAACDAGLLDACDRIVQYTRADDPGLPAPLPVLSYSRALSRDAYETEICFTQSEIFRGKTYTHFACPRTEKGIGGNRASHDEAPWQALLWRPERLNGKDVGVTRQVLCGGTLIATGWVLTAAHCLTDNGNAISTAGHRIRLGVFNPLADEGISYPIVRAIPHPQYDPANKFALDIALVQFDARAGRIGTASNPDSVRRRGAIVPAKLDALGVGQRRIVRGMPAYSYGWGWTETQSSKSTNYLQIVIMEIMSEQACTKQTGFVNSLSDAALCVGGRRGEQMCFGDSGGPLVQYGNRGAEATLIGVVSAGVKIPVVKDGVTIGYKTCGETGLPSQYTRVAKVRDWIARYVDAAR